MVVGIDPTSKQITALNNRCWTNRRLITYATTPIVYHVPAKFYYVGIFVLWPFWLWPFWFVDGLTCMPLVCGRYNVQPVMRIGDSTLNLQQGYAMYINGGVSSDYDEENPRV